MKKFLLIPVVACFLAFTTQAQTPATAQTKGTTTEKQAPADHSKATTADSKDSKSDLKQTCGGGSGQKNGKSCCKGKSGSCSHDKAKACNHASEESGEAQPAEKKEETKTGK